MSFQFLHLKLQSADRIYGNKTFRKKLQKLNFNQHQYEPYLISMERQNSKERNVLFKSLSISINLTNSIRTPRGLKRLT